MELSVFLAALRHHTLDMALCLKLIPGEICSVDLQIKSFLLVFLQELISEIC